MKRIAIAIFLWLLIISAFFFSFRSSVITTKLIDRYRESISTDMVNEHILATEFATQYITEWLTWHPEETDEKRLARLQAFNPNLVNGGITKIEQPFIPSSVTILNCEKVGQSYSIKALVIGGNKPMTFEVKVSFKDNRPYSYTQPLMIANTELAVESKRKFDISSDEQIIVFVQRFLESYLEGTTESDTAIFTVSDVTILPTGNSTLVNLIEVYSDQNTNPSTIKAKYLTSIEGTTIDQEMIIHIIWKDGKPLINQIEA